MIIKTKGIILSRRPYKNQKIFLTLFTENLGLIEAIFYENSKNVSVSAVFTYAFFEFSESFDMLRLSGGEIIYSFHAISQDLRGFALSAYFVEIVKSCFSETDKINNIDIDMNANFLRFFTITLYETIKKRTPLEIIKGVFEFRVSRVAGLSPDLVGCAECRILPDYMNMTENLWFNTEENCYYCGECYSKNGKNYIELPPRVIKLMSDAIFSHSDQIYKMAKEKDGVLVEIFYKFAEQYFLHHFNFHEKSQVIKALKYSKGVV